MIRLAAASLLIAGSAAIAASAPLQGEAVPVDLVVQQARKDAADALAEQKRLESAAAAARDEASRLQARQLAAAEAISAAEAQISAADAEAQLVQAQLSLQRQRLASQQAPVSSLLAGLALTARRPPVLLLAGGGSAENIVKLRLLIEATAPAIQARTAALASELQRGIRLEQAVLAARAERIRSREELARKRDAFAELEARATEMAEARGSQALGAGDVALARGEQLAAVEQQAQSAASARKMAQQLAAFGPAPLPAGAGGMNQGAPLDYRLPAQAPVTDGLGEVSANGVRSRGITLATRRGAPLTAPASGTILFSGPFRDFDGVVIIDHGNGWKSVLVNAGSKLPHGSRVRIGDPIGTALGRVEVQLQHGGQSVSPALIAGSSAMLSNGRKSG